MGQISLINDNPERKLITTIEVAIPIVGPRTSNIIPLWVMKVCSEIPVTVWGMWDEMAFPIW